jgi:RecA-family ATPase
VIRFGVNALGDLPHLTLEDRQFGDVARWFSNWKNRTPWSQGATAKLIWLKDVEPTEVKWVWPGRIPCGKLTLLVGDPGLGKSFVTLDGGSRISRGRLWPDGEQAPLGAVIVLSAEDGRADTIRPRVDVLGGDPAKIAVLAAIKQGDAERPFSLAADLPVLEATITAVQAVLVVIDPLSAYLGKTDSFKDAEVRGLLTPLAALAEKTGVAILAIMHLTKNPAQRAIYRAPGTIGFAAAARVMLAVAAPRQPRSSLTDSGQDEPHGQAGDAGVYRGRAGAHLGDQSGPGRGN